MMTAIISGNPNKASNDNNNSTVSVSKIVIITILGNVTSCI